MDEVQLHATFRTETPGRPTLGRHDVHVWAVPLLGSAERYSVLLTPEERERASRFRVVDHRRRYAIAHGALRAILAGYLGADPLAIPFRLTAAGKPALDGGEGLCFNLSHSAQLGLIAIAGADVGVDLEKVRHLESLRGIAQRHFSRSECEALEALSEPDLLLGFYRCWTRKEAYVKALGTGLTSALDVFDVALGDDAELLAVRDRQEDLANWSLRDASPGPDYVAAVAVRHGSARVQCFALEGT